MSAKSHLGERERGQAIVLVALALATLLAMAALIIDAGNAWARQRQTQNGSDAAALAGSVVLVKKLSGSAEPPGGWDAAVAAAVTTAGANNQITVSAAYYTDHQGNLLTAGGTPAGGTAEAAQVGGGAIPPGGQGVEAHGEQAFQSYLAGIAGQGSFTARTQATAAAGPLTGICAASAGCAALPLTVPVRTSTCDGSGSLQPGEGPWPIVEESAANQSNMSTIPLCKTGPGSVGWLDYDCGGNLSSEITDPCNLAFDLPTWIDNVPGDNNSVEREVDQYKGEIILIPMFDGTCKDEPSGGSLADCTREGVGTNTWYHIPQFAAFLLYDAYIQGNNVPECNSAPGNPTNAAGNGSNGCLKGWFVKYITAGPVGPIGGSGANDPGIYGTQLLR